MIVATRFYCEFCICCCCCLVWCWFAVWLILNLLVMIHFFLTTFTDSDSVYSFLAIIPAPFFCLRVKARKVQWYIFLPEVVCKQFVYPFFFLYIYIFFCFLQHCFLVFCFFSCSFLASMFCKSFGNFILEFLFDRSL